MWFCKHKWEVLSETTTESYAKQFSDLSGDFIKPRDALDLEPLFERKLIQILTCIKCGKVRQFVTQV